MAPFSESERSLLGLFAAFEISSTNTEKSFNAVFTSNRTSVVNAFVYSAGANRSAAVTMEGKTESLTGASDVHNADGVNGAVMARRDSLVTWAFRDFAPLDTRTRGGGEEEVSVVVDVFPVAAGGVVSNVVWNCSESARAVFKRMGNFSAIFFLLYSVPCANLYTIGSWQNQHVCMHVVCVWCGGDVFFFVIRSDKFSVSG